MKTYRQILKNLSEASLDSNHLMRSISILIDDFKSGPKEDRKIVPVLQWVHDRINQSFPDGDVSENDIKEFLTGEPSGRKLLKKSGMSSLEIINFIFEM